MSIKTKQETYSIRIHHLWTESMKSTVSKFRKKTKESEAEFTRVAVQERIARISNGGVE